MRKENIKQNRNKLLAYSVYTPSHDELDFFMTIELTSICIKNVFKDLYGISTSETWFPNKYIENDIRKKVDKTKEQLVSDEMVYNIRQYIDSLKHDPSLVGRIRNDINKLLVNHEYNDFFIQIYIQWSSDNSIECLSHFEKMTLSQFKVYIEAEKLDKFLCVGTS